MHYHRRRKHKLRRYFEKLDVPVDYNKVFDYEYRSKKNPMIAFLLSFIPGLGQLYNGQLTKAFFFFIFGWMPLIYILNIYDAYTSAIKINKSIEARNIYTFRRTLKDIEEKKTSTIEKPIEPEKKIEKRQRAISEVSISKDEIKKKSWWSKLSEWEKLEFIGFSIGSIGSVLVVSNIWLSNSFTLLSGLVSFAVGTVAGIFGLRKEKQRQLEKSKENEKRLIKEIIEILSKKESLSLSKIVRETNLSIEEAESLLQTLVRKGIVDLEVKPSGTIEYKIYE